MLPLHPVVVALLRPHKAAQAAERLRAGDQWAGTNNLVFMTELGRPVDPRNLLRVVEAAAKPASVEGVAVHTLRHSAAVGWLEAGVHIKAVADLLGHSSISTTGDVYGHTSDEELSIPVDRLLGVAGCLPCGAGGTLGLAAAIGESVSDAVSGGGERHVVWGDDFGDRIRHRRDMPAALSISTLLGVGLYQLTGAAWLDPVAGFIIAVFAIHEGREAWHGELVDEE